MKELRLRLYHGYPVLYVSLIEGSQPPQVRCVLYSEDSGISSLLRSEVTIPYAEYRQCPWVTYRAREGQP